MGIIAAVFTLVAAFFGVSSLTAFGFGAWDIVVILVPMAIGVALFFWGVLRFGLWTARALNRAGDGEGRGKKQDGPGSGD